MPYNVSIYGVVGLVGLAKAGEARPARTTAANYVANLMFIAKITNSSHCASHYAVYTMLADRLRASARRGTSVKMKCASSQCRPLKR